MADAQRRRVGHIPIHQRLLQPAAAAFSVGLEKPGRLRKESGLNENLGRHESVTGPKFLLVDDDKLLPSRVENIDKLLARRAQDGLVVIKQKLDRHERSTV